MSVIRDKYCSVLAHEIEKVKQVVGMSIPRKQRRAFITELPTEGFLSYLILLALEKKKRVALREEDAGYPYYIMKADLEPSGVPARLISEAAAYAEPHFEPKERLTELGIFGFNNGSLKNDFLHSLIRDLTWGDRHALLEKVISDQSLFFSNKEVFYPPPSQMLYQNLLPSQYPITNLVDIWTGRLRDLCKKIDPSIELLRDGLDFLAKAISIKDGIPDSKIEIILGDLINTYLDQVIEIWISWVRKGQNIKELLTFLECLLKLSLRNQGAPNKALERIGRAILNSLVPKEKPVAGEKDLLKLVQGFLFKPLSLEEGLKLLNAFTNKIKSECDRLQKDYPFKKYIVLVIQHFLRDLDPFIEGLQKLGADPKDIILFCKPYPYPHREALTTHFEKREKITVIACEGKDVARSDIKRIFEKAMERNKETGKKILIIEDGGYLGPYINKLKTIDISSFCKGAVEQTTKGSREYEKVAKKLKFPLLNVAKSNFKKDYEAPFIGRAVVRNIRSMLPDKHLHACKALVIGFGSIGREIAKCLYYSEGMRVIVAELYDKKKFRDARGSDFVEKAVRRLTRNTVRDCVLIIGTTGTQTIKENVIGYAGDGAVLVSASSDRREVDVNTLTDLCKQEIPVEIDGSIVGTKYKLTIQNEKEIVLLANGYPINFFASESVPNESIDPILTTLFLSAVEIATTNINPGIHTERVDRLVENKYKVKREFQMVHGIYR